MCGDSKQQGTDNDGNGTTKECRKEEIHTPKDASLDTSNDGGEESLDMVPWNLPKFTTHGGLS